MKMSLLETILEPERLYVLFQPIFRIDGTFDEVNSFEALIRGPRGTNFERADVLFDYVRRKKAETAMDRTCFAAISKVASALPPQFRLNINVHASTIANPTGFTDFIWDLAEKRSLALDRLTIEIVEHTPTCNVPALIDNITALRDSGVRIALDDVGLGQSNYRMMLDCHPEYFKLDAYFVRGVKVDPKRRAVVQSVVTLAAALDSSVVAEGVESPEDVVVLKEMGVPFVQANLLCPPTSMDDLWETGLLGPRVSRGTDQISDPRLAGDRRPQLILSAAAVR